MTRALVSCLRVSTIAELMVYSEARPYTRRFSDVHTTIHFFQNQLPSHQLYEQNRQKLRTFSLHPEKTGWLLFPYFPVPVMRYPIAAPLKTHLRRSIVINRWVGRFEPLHPSEIPFAQASAYRKWTENEPTYRSSARLHQQTF